MVVYKPLELLEILIGMQMKAGIFCSGQTEDFQVKQNFGGHLFKISNTNFNRKMFAPFDSFYHFRWPLLQGTLGYG